MHGHSDGMLGLIMFNQYYQAVMKLILGDIFGQKSPNLYDPYDNIRPQKVNYMFPGHVLLNELHCTITIQ